MRLKAAVRLVGECVLELDGVRGSREARPAARLPPAALGYSAASANPSSAPRQVATSSNGSRVACRNALRPQKALSRRSNIAVARVDFDAVTDAAGALRRDQGGA